MLKKIPIFFAIIIGMQIACTGEKDLPKPFYEMTNLEIDTLLKETSQRNMTISERITFYSERFIGTPYNFKCVGDGPYALMESYSLINFAETNCMAFCEHVLALSISDSWDNFFNNLQHIRYRDGIIGMRTRNHYTMADWLPENKWLLEDVSRIVGGKYIQSVTRTISHKNFFENKGITDMRYVLPDREITIDYVPKEDLVKIEKNAKSGDILALIFANKTDIFSAHMLMVIEKSGKKYIRESSTSKMNTFDTPYRDWALKKQDIDKYLGLCFMRVRKDIDVPGKLILPWEIEKLKSEKSST
ncbi:MAG: DUF1460 domain-containing protein [Candidatus Marinimicrobia bacterium]|nr:DUF1460 domain-containing protein [Candidatus Neomarinimicrobiota bacterium]